MRERECPRCHRTVDLPLGELCDVCTREINARAARAARWVSLGTTLVFGLYVMSVLPPLQGPRMIGAAATVTWFLVTRRITARIVSEWLRAR
ncbi:MAG: hypothetical protein OEY20_08220 [Gemmatimonadota bacterium]|nr:hypothetical protein [Gemmatimonadota bacterium]MDH4350877.1 hypothetical protein [Gemmatimonadota bacterium]MDH5197221.1 hypothetical protein [Gemmatimonadota bacterium]